jgi:hypothetical protein
LTTSSGNTIVKEIVVPFNIFETGGTLTIGQIGDGVHWSYKDDKMLSSPEQALRISVDFSKSSQFDVSTVVLNGVTVVS